MHLKKNPVPNFKDLGMSLTPLNCFLIKLNLMECFHWAQYTVYYNEWATPIVIVSKLDRKNNFLMIMK